MKLQYSHSTGQLRLSMFSLQIWGADNIKRDRISWSRLSFPKLATLIFQFLHSCRTCQPREVESNFLLGPGWCFVTTLRTWRKDVWLPSLGHKSLNLALFWDTHLWETSSHVAGPHGGPSPQPASTANTWVPLQMLLLFTLPILFLHPTWCQVEGTQCPHHAPSKLQTCDQNKHDHCLQLLFWVICSTAIGILTFCQYFVTFHQENNLTII